MNTRENNPSAARYGATLEVRHLIDGEEVSGAGGRFESRNPSAPQDLVAVAPVATDEEVRAACRAAARAAPAWRNTPMPQRAQVLENAARLLKHHEAELARTVSREMGKIAPGSRGEVHDAIFNCEAYAARRYGVVGERVAGTRPGAEPGVRRQPLGVAALIAAGNYPLAIPFWKLCPALLTGNTVVFKPSQDVPAVGYLIGALLQAAGAPAGVVNVVHGGVGPGEALLTCVEDGLVQKVSFTGSTAVGRRIGEVCGRSLASASLELGGKNPLVIGEGVPVEQAVQRAFGGAFANTGQRCTSTANVILPRDMVPAFTAAFVEKLEGLRIGDPVLFPDVDMGGLITERYLDPFLTHYDWGRADGATLVYGDGRIRPDSRPAGFQGEIGEGVYVWPTLWSDVRPDMDIAQREIFGPTVNLVPVDSFDEAMDAATAHSYGLTAALLSPDPVHQRRFRDEIGAGMVHINSAGGGVLPFGGNGWSGNGTRELGPWALEAYTRVQSVNIGCADYQPAQLSPGEAADSAGDWAPLAPDMDVETS